MTSPVGLLKEKTLKSVRRIDISNMEMKVGMFTARSVVNLKPFKEEGGLDPPEIEGLSNSWVSRDVKLCPNQCTPCWCSSGVKFMLIIVHFYSNASLLPLYYFANYMNIQDKIDKSTGHSTKCIPVLSEYAKSLESRVKGRYSRKRSRT